MKKTLNKIIAVVISLVLILSLSTVAFAENELPFADSQFYTQGDYSIHYRVIPNKGEFKGRILFMHGFMYSTETWNGVAEKVSEQGYECVLADLPNFGYSTRESENVNPVFREDLMVGLMESIAPLNQWIVAGHSMGGGVAVNIAGEHPEIKGLMLYAPAAQSVADASMEKLITNSFLTSFMQKIANVVLKLKYFVKLCVGIAAKDFSYGLNYDTDVFTKPLSIDGTMNGICYLTLRTKETDLESIDKITAPVLLVWGEKDSVLQKSDCGRITDAFGEKAKVCTVNGGHIFIEVQAQQTADITVDFLNNL